MNAESMLPDWNIYYRNEYMKNVWLKECNKMIKDNTGMYSLKKILLDNGLYILKLLNILMMLNKSIIQCYWVGLTINAISNYLRWIY